MVKGGDSKSEGCEFESKRLILDEHISHLFIVRIVMLVKRNKRKRGRSWPILKNVKTNGGRVRLLRLTSDLFKTLLLRPHI